MKILINTTDYADMLTWLHTVVAENYNENLNNYKMIPGGPTGHSIIEWRSKDLTSWILRLTKSFDIMDEEDIGIAVHIEDEKYAAWFALKWQ